MYTLFYWLPRVLSIAFIIFLSVFALDVFEQYHGWDAAIPLLIHLIPSFTLLLVTLAAWKYELVGVVVYIGFAVFYVLAAGFDRPWTWYTAISGPSALLGVLYTVSFIARRRTRTNKSNPPTR